MAGPQFEGRYFDGRSAARHDVAVMIDSTGIHLSRGPFAGGEIWPFDAVRLLSREPHDSGLTLTRRDDDGVRLTILGTGAWRAIETRAPDVSKLEAPTGLRMPFVITAATLALFVAVYFAFPYFAGAVAGLVPAGVADKLGALVAGTIVDEESLCTGAQGNRVLEALIADLGGDGMAIKASVVDHPMQNALAAPGGRIVVFHGLLAKAHSSDEVAGVIAHEMGHVKNRHPLKRLVEVFGLQLFFGSIGSDIGGIGGILTILSYGRADEAEADAEAVAFLNEAGISAEGFAGFFERLASGDDYGGMVTGFLSTHPQHADRVAHIRAKARRDASRPALSEEDWKLLKDICAGKTDKDEAEEAGEVADE